MVGRVNITQKNPKEKKTNYGTVRYRSGSRGTCADMSRVDIQYSQSPRVR